MDFEFVEKYKDCGLALPERATQGSAGHDLAAAEDYIIPSYLNQMEGLRNFSSPYDMEKLAEITKKIKARPTLVSTGVKCDLQPGTYLELSIRSSVPLKYGLTLANGVGIIDADYYNNPDNEGEIFLQIINWGPSPVIVKKGTKLGQGVIKPYLLTESDNATGERVGGFGSTNG